MQLRNHIVYHFLNSPNIVSDASIKDYKDSVPEVSEDTVTLIKKIINIDGNKSYYITNSIINNLDLLKIDTNNWEILDGRPNAKYTFIFSDGSFLRLLIDDRDFLFYYVSRIGKDTSASYFYHSFYDNKESGDFAFKKDFWFKLLCFFFYSQNKEIIVSPGKSYGTRKQMDSLSNDSKYPITIVNSNWNVTSIRLHGFNVSGHFRLQPCGFQFSETKMIFIEPFKKNGYVRKAIKNNHV